jgi:YidC/Oxa1 family membrane protein insertase
MEKRVLIAIALCIGVLILWTQLFSPPPPTPQPPAPAPAPGQTAPVPGQAGQAAPPAAPAAPGAPAAAGTGTTPPGAPAADRPEKLVEIHTPDVRFVFSSRGGTLVHAQLKEKQFQEKKDKDSPPVPHDVVRTTDAADAPLRIAFPAGIPTPPDGAWETSQPTPDAVVFAADAGNVHIEKRYRLDKARYRLTLDVVVANRGDTIIGSTLVLSIGGRQDPESRGGGFFSGVSANVSSALCFVNGSVERKAIESLAKDPISDKDGTGAVNWIATDEKFFLLAAVPYPDPPPAQARTCATRATGTDAGQVTLRFAERTVAAKAEVVYPFLVFAGPKVTGDLEVVQPMVAAAPGLPPAPVLVHLEKAVDVTLAPIAGPILTLLKFFHRFTHNWGLAIVLLTLFIKMLTFYPTQKSLVSAKKMQKLAPKMAAIRKKYENDRQRQSVETMNLYKSHGVSPFGGCLPSLIQMPIWIALYSTLNYAVELYQAPFVFHIHDLTAKDPFYVTPLVMGGVMFAQMKMSPAGADPQQQAMMSVLMPIMFTGFSLFLPSGLAVYMLTSYLFGILQQLYVNYLDRKGKISL